MSEAFIGVDVGTGSARAAAFDWAGRLLGAAKRPIAIWHEAGGVVEQSSADIWAAVVGAVRQAVAAAGLSPEDVAGIGFDATCSLVAVGPGGEPVAVGPSGDPARDVIVWMDHRAGDQARRINATGHDVLRYVGGVISPEMETPKLLWLKENLPAAFAAAEHFFDLSDYLTFRATGNPARSVCTVTCKWTYLAHERRWDEGYFRAIGLGELADEGFARIGTTVLDAGTPVGSGLSAEAAAAFGLKPGTAVGAALIDAHAGGIGSVGAANHDGSAGDPTARIAYILGTSACAMATTAEPCFVPGVWGPYHSAMVPGLWLNEGGQSAAGAAIDHLLRLYPGHEAARAKADQAGVPLFVWLEDELARAASSPGEAARLAATLHVVPDFLGNRSPDADPEARGIIAGLGLQDDAAGFVRLYVAGLCGVGYGARRIVRSLAEHGVAIETMVMSGGAGQSAFVRQIMADATGLPVAVPETEEPVLLGAAMLGAVAAGAHGSIQDAMSAMSRLGATYAPASGALRDFHDAKHAVFEMLVESDRKARALMAAVSR